VKFGARVWIWSFIPHAKYYKKMLNGMCSLWTNLYQKLKILGVVSPYFL